MKENQTSRDLDSLPAILVSGGAGYIGSHTVQALKQAGYSPVVIDSMVSGHAWATEYATEFYESDISDSDAVREICRKHRPVAALHFAAFIEVGESVANPKKYFLNNYTKASQFFDVLDLHGVNKIVFSSTAAVYGEPLHNRPLIEADATSPVNPYGESKLKAESYLRSLNNVKSVALRYFNVAGGAPEHGLGEAHYPESHLIPRLIIPLLGEPELCSLLGLRQGATIYGDDYPTADGTPLRDYVHVLDLADAHVLALKYLIGGGATNIFNLGSGSGYSVKEVVAAVATVLERPDFNPEIGPRRAGDPATLVAGNAKAARILGWRPSRDLAEMISTAARWHRTPRYRCAIMAKIENANS